MANSDSKVDPGVFTSLGGGSSMHKSQNTVKKNLASPPGKKLLHFFQKIANHMLKSLESLLPFRSEK
jgi:hypothetical protein